MTGPYSVRPWWNRRGFLKGSVAAAAGAYGLSSYFATAAPVPEKFDGSAFKLKAPEPNAKSGGVLRHGMPLRAPHFDIHQAGTIFILGAAACMFDNLIRRDPDDGANTIIPDLAHSWGMPRMARPTRSIFARACNSKHRGLADTLPFPDAGFDYVLSWNVIHHGTLGDLGRRLGEIWRVLRPAGLLQATVLSTRDANYGIGRAIAPDTFVIDQVERKGHPHCYCDAATLVGLLAGFDLLTLSQQLQERRPGSHHWHIIAERRG